MGAYQFGTTCHTCLPLPPLKGTQMPESVPLTQRDIIFKKVFASLGNEDILAGLLKDVLGLNAESLQIVTPYNIEDYKRSRRQSPLFTEVDAACILPDGTSITVEIQYQEHDYYRERMVHYLCSRYTRGYAREEFFEEGVQGHALNFSSLGDAYELCILGFTHFGSDDDVLHSFTLYDKEHEFPYFGSSGGNPLNLTFLELPKQGNIKTVNLKHWLDYFCRGKVTEDAPVYIKKACRVASRSSLTEEEVAVFTKEERERAVTEAILSTRYRVGREEGLEQGLQQGERQKALEIANAALAEGIDIITIERLTGLDADVIKAL